MTIQNENVLVEFAGDGATTLFTYNFRILKAADLTVLLIDSAGVPTTQVLATDYTLIGVGVENGFVTMIVPPAADEFLSIFLDPAFEQSAEYEPGGAFPSTVHEAALDATVNQSKNLLYRADRSLQRADGDQGALGVYDALTQQISNLGNPVADLDATTKSYVDAEIASAVLDPTVPVSPYGGTLIDDADAAEARLTLGALATGVALFISATASAAMDALGFSTYFKTLVAAADASAFRALFFGPRWNEIALPNLLLDGDHQVWQFGETFNSTTPAAGGNDDGEWMSDGWVLLSNTNDSVDVASEFVDVPDGARGAMKVTTVLANDQHGFAQWIESFRSIPLRSKKVSLSIWVKATGDLTNFKAHIISWSGLVDDATKDFVSSWPGGAADITPIANVSLVDDVAIVGTSSWVEHTLDNITVPADCENLGVFLVTDDGAFTAAQDYFWTAPNLVENVRATKFRSRTFLEELTEAERFYQTTFPYGTVPAEAGGTIGALVTRATDVAGGSNPDLSVMWRYRTPQRLISIFTLYNPEASGNDWEEIGGTNTVNATIEKQSIDSVHIFGGEASINERYHIHASSDARWQ